MAMTKRAFAALLVVLASCTSAHEPARSASPAASSPVARRTPEQRPTDIFALARSLDVPTARELARRIVGAESAIRSAGEPDARVAAHARLQQAAYRQLVRTPDWQTDVLHHVPHRMESTARANLEAGSDLVRLTQPRTELPEWRIVAPPPADELRRDYNAAQESFGIDWEVLAAIHLVETRMGRIRGTSTAGARGPMQFLPSTWERWGEGDIEDAGDAIRAAARYLRAHGATADMRRALFAYNHSDLYVRAVTLYADVMREDALAYRGYYHWDVYYRTTRGDALLYEGWPTR